MRSICCSNKLNIADEKDLVGLFEKYLAHRDNLPLLKEEDPSLDWSHLTVAEKEGRQKAAEEKQAEEAKKQEEEKKAQDDAYNALDPLGKANADWNKKIDAVHAECANRLVLSRLSKQQKVDLFQTIRYSFMKHEDLLSLTSNTRFELAKDFIVEGLSVRLNPFENGIKSDLKINTEPRVNFEPSKQDAAGAGAGGVPSSLKKTNFENYYERKLHDVRAGHNALEQKLLGAAIGKNIKDLMHVSNEHITQKGF